MFGAIVAVGFAVELLKLSETNQIYQQRIAERLANVSPHEQVRKFTLLAKPFSIEAGELTPKLSLRRKQIGEHYSREIEAMYARKNDE